MIKQIAKPDGFEHLTDGHAWTWLLIHDDKRKIGYLGLQILEDEAGVHYQSINWGLGAAKTLKDDWRHIIRRLQRIGVKSLIASFENINDVKWHKFIRLFGFPEPRAILISKMEI